MERDRNYLEAENTTLTAEVVALRRFLQQIKDEAGRVCENFETCEHRACRSSYGAWVIAYLALGRPVPEAAPKGGSNVA